MTKKITYIPNRVIDVNGISDGAQVYVYRTGGTTPVDIYLDEELNTPAANPYPVPSGAAVPRFWYDYDGQIRVRVVTTSGVVIQDDDPYEVTISADELSATSGDTVGADLVGITGGGTLSDYIPYVSANAFGVTPDTDLNSSGYPNNPESQSAALQAAVDFADARGIALVKIKGPGVVLLDSTITVPFGITIEGDTSRAMNASEYGEVLEIATMSTGSFNTSTNNNTVSVANDGSTEGGFMFFMNVSVSNTSTWIRQFPNIGSGGLKHLHLNGTASGGVNVAFFAGSYTFEDLRLTKIGTLAEKPSGIYTDAFKAANVFARLRANGTDPLIKLPGNGDAYEIRDIAAGYTGSQTGVVHALDIGLCRSGSFSHVVNGISTFTNCSGTVSEFHVETGQIIVDAGHMTVQNCKLYNGKNGLVPIVVRNTLFTGSFTAGTAIIRGNNFIHSLNAVGDVDGWSDTTQLDVRCEDSRMDLTMGTGNRRTITISGQLSRNHVMAPLVGNGSGEYTNWRNHAHWLCYNNVNISNDVVDVTGIMQDIPGAGSITAASFTTSSGDTEDLTFNDGKADSTTTTYYYSIDFVADPGRKLGRTGNEVSQSATTGSSTLPALRLNTGTLRKPSGYIARIYRGEAAGSYDKYVDVPVIECRELIDDGEALNSYAWKTNPAAPSKITLNNNAQNGTLHYRMGLLEGFNITFNGNPSAGGWLQGDRLHIASTADHEGRLCTVSGGPGTWVKLGIKGAEKAAASASTYTGPTGGTTVDAEARTSLGQLASDLADLKAKLTAAGLQS